MTISDSNSEARFLALLDAAVDGILVIDANGIIETFNRAAEILFGYSASEVIAKKVNMLMPAPYREEHDGYIMHYLQTGERKVIGIGREVSARRKNGEEFPIELSVGEIHHGDEPKFVGIIRDLTERKETARLLRQQQERLDQVMRLGTLGEMAAGIAHEINQPLTAISTYSQAARRMIVSGQLQEERLLEILDKTRNQAVRAGEVIRRIRQMARNRPAARELRDAATVVDEALQLAETDSRLQKVALLRRDEKHRPQAWLDSVQIQQVLLNLLHNAVETDPPPTQLLVRVYSTKPEEITVEVSDNGPGIPADLLSEIFNPFFTTKEQGTGMGLSISRSIVAAHGGRLEASSSSTGGATFSVVLPTAIDEKNAAD
ncbi:MAG: PAS domain S-box protein [Gammaproteobacteria bacterium]|nr:PAS domain S-box protein [Gammaproteobacteria bacterium]NNF61845.1 PAS domain S-box protein [Gammaproteobacteria bacterium]